MAGTERFPIDFPGFLRSAEGGYIKHEDFLTFIAGASSAKAGDTTTRAMAWLRRQGVSGDLQTLSPVEVSRLTSAAEKVIAAKHGRARRGGSSVAPSDAPIPLDPDDEFET